MDTIATIIVTAFFNIAISSFLFYRYQKKIENTFAKSLYEYQTKFSRNYPKTLEVLEMYHQKFLNFRKLSFDFAEKMYSYNFNLDTVRSEVIDHEIDNIVLAISDLNTYFRNNRIHLPEPSVREIEGISYKTDTLYQLLLAATYISDMSPYNLAIFLKSRQKFEGMDTEKIDPTSKNVPYLYTDQICNELNMVLEQLEKHYKSVADIAKE